MKNHFTFFSLLLFASFWLIISNAFSQTPELIKDIDKITANAVHPQHLIAWNGIAYFDMADDMHGDELWRSDGTKQGTYLVKDINPGQDGSGPNYFVISGNTLFFSAVDKIHGPELWKTDGTPAGTQLVKDISTNPFSYCIPLLDLNGKLLIQSGFQLWMSDGTAAGTTFLANVNLNTFDSKKNMLVVNGVAYFPGSSSLNDYELWRTDGTGAGTYRVKDINGGSGDSNPRYLVNINGTIYFSATDNTHSTELWKSDGTTAGTQLVKDIAAGGTAGDPAFLVNLNGTLYFSASDNIHGTELWKSDGTAAGTAMVKDINVTSNSSPANLTVFNNNIFFSATTSTQGNELWKSDGTATGTILLKDIKSGNKSSSPYSFVQSGGLLYFNAVNNYKTDLMRTDGTIPGTVVVKGGFLLAPVDVIGFNDDLLFSATQCSCAYELWKSDGTAAGTDAVGEITNENMGSIVNTSFLAGNILYLNLEDGITGADGGELWKSDGTASGTVLVKDIDPGYFGSAPRNFIQFMDKTYFVAYNATSGSELWQTDGTADGTVLVKDILPGSAGSYPKNLLLYNNNLYFTASNASNSGALWKSDGTAIGTVKVDASVQPPYSDQYNLIAYNGKLFFFGYNSAKGWELYQSDGTAAGTVLLKDINPGSGGSGNGFHTGEIVVSGSYLFFTAYTDATGTELWRSDGTAAGTILLKDIDQGNNPDDIVPAQLTDVNGTLFFTDGDEFTGTELWKSNGTAAGTLLVKDIIPGNDQNSPKYLTNVNGTLFFNSGDPASINSLELWKSDGSANGTVLVKLITPAGPDPQSLKAVNGLLYFSANDGTYGRELWISDGSVCGTQRLTDIYPGAGSSNPYVINVLNNEILFAATQPDIGSEYWKIAASGIPSPLKTFVPLPGFCPGDAASVTFDFSCNVNAGNVYTVQLSNASGNFSNPLTIGSLASQNTSGSIPIQIPNTASGSHFRIRTVASDPAVTGADNGNDLAISCPPPTNFQVAAVNSSSATLNWNDVSCAEKFQLRYRVAGTSSWLKVNTSGTSKTLSSLQANTNYEVQVHSKCASGPDVFSAFTPSLFFATQPLKESPGQESMLLSDFKIYPNPATAIVTVTLSLPADTYTEIILTDVQGRNIRSIAEGNFAAGSYSLDFPVNDLPAGIYFVECRINSIVQSKKLLVQ